MVEGLEYFSTILVKFWQFPVNGFILQPQVQRSGHFASKNCVYFYYEQDKTCVCPDMLVILFNDWTIPRQSMHLCTCFTILCWSNKELKIVLFLTIELFGYVRPDFQKKEVLYTHPTFQFWQDITCLVVELSLQNFVDWIVQH